MRRSQDLTSFNPLQKARKLKAERKMYKNDAEKVLEKREKQKRGKIKIRMEGKEKKREQVNRKNRYYRVI
jgi:hypothetical protein